MPYTDILNGSYNYKNSLINELYDGAGGQIHGANGFLNAYSVKRYTIYVISNGGEVI